VPKTGRPKKEYNRKLFVDLIGLGCGADEICWVFREEDGKPANIDTVSRWCKREFGCTFQEFRVKNGAMALKVAVRKNQLELSKKSAAMAIFLGKNYLGQTDNPQTVTEPEAATADDALTAALREEAAKMEAGAEEESNE